MRHDVAWLCVVIGLLVVAVAGGRAPTQVSAEPAMDRATLAEVRKLQEKRRDLLREALEVRTKLYQSGRAELDGVIDTSKKLLAAELDLAATGAERIAAHERQYEKAQAFVEIAKARQQAARGTGVSVFDAQAYSLEAQIGLLKAGGKPKKSEK